MRRDEVLAILRAHRAELEGLGVRAVWLFGSVVRDEAEPGSDVDLLVELARPMGWEFFDIQVASERWLGCQVDVGTLDSLKPRIRQRVLTEAVRVA